MRIKFLYTILLICLFQATVSAQNAKTAKPGSFFRIAEKEFNDQRYTYAIQFYKASLKHEKPSRDSIIIAHMAESYWHVKAYDSAQQYYLLYEKKYGTTFVSGQRLAEIAGTKKQYTDAAKIYQRVMHDNPADQPALVSARLKGFTDVEPFLKDSQDYTIRLLQLNTKQQDFSPQYYRGGVVFVSNRFTRTSSEKQFGWDGLPYANIYVVRDTTELTGMDTLPARVENDSYNKPIKANDDFTARTSNDNDIVIGGSMRAVNTGGEVHRLVKFTDDLNTKYNYGPLCFNSAGTKVYFTRNTLKAYKGRFNLEICEATLVNNEWHNTRTLPFVDIAYDFYHPALTADGKKLYFCSNRPGGKGGSDIYYVNMESDSTMEFPVLLDEKINTTGDELFPTIKGDTLYFSSDGHGGLGGLDIYMAIADKNTWKAPVNVGYPLNSPYDDFGIVFSEDRSKGLFSSNRLGSDDIFSFANAANTIKLTGTVFDKSTMRRLEGAKVVIREIINEAPAKDSIVTTITGNFIFPVKTNHAYQLAFTKDGYTQDSITVNKTNIVKDIELAPAFLAPIPKVQPAPVIKDADGDGVEDSKDKCPTKRGLTNNSGCPDIQSRLNELAKMVFFKTASAELSPAALKPLNEAAEILAEYPNTTLDIEGHTDNRAGAAYNKDLSQRRAASVKAFFVSKGLKPNRFTSVVGYGLERPIGDNTTDEGRQMNRRVSIKATFIF